MNFWPTIDDVYKTEDAIPFLNDTINELKQKYNGRIQAQLCRIEFVLKSFRSMRSMIEEMSTLVGPQKNEDKYECEEKMDIEKNRKTAVVANRDYKYEIFNDHLYYKLFTINIPEFYPIKIRAAAGTLEKEDSEVVIKNLSELKDVFSRIVLSDKVKQIIKKML